ncbi:hypothetical protein D3C87_1652730 [compost metagenome]
MGQAIEGVGGQQQSIEQQGVGRDSGVTQSRTLYGDQEKHRLQGQAADKNVTVDRQQRTPALPPAQGCPDDMAGVGAQRLTGHQQTDQRAGPFGDHRSPGGTDHAPFQAQHKPQVQGDVDQVGAQENRQRRAGVLRAEEPADQCITGQRRGQPEQPRMEKLAGHLIQFCRRLHEMQRDPA